MCGITKAGRKQFEEQCVGWQTNAVDPDTKTRPVHIVVGEIAEALAVPADPEVSGLGGAFLFSEQ